MRLIGKKRKSLPVLAVCRNCGTTLQGPYCDQCGQNLFVGVRRSVKDLTFNVLENMFVLDNKLVSTLKYLLFYPGKLTQEYMRGRIVRYVHPSKLFWFISILFFTLLTYQIKSDQNDPVENKETINSVISETITPTDTKKETDPQAKSQIQKSKEEEREEREERIFKENLKSYVFTYSPYVSFVLIPFFALLLFVFFYKRNYFYVDYLAFSLHFHAFVFLLFTLYLAIYWAFPSFDFHKTVFLLLPLVYFLRAIWVVYRPKLGALIGKTFLIVTIYGIVMLIIMATFLILIICLTNPDLID